MTRLSLCAALAVLAAPAAVQAKDKYEPFTLQKLLGSDSFTIKATEKLRYEGFDNSFRPTGAESSDLLTIRTTLEMEYHANGLRIGAEVRDTRGYWHDRSTPVTAAEINTLEPVQLYVGADLGKIGNGKAEITVGRFLMNFGSRRLIGATQFRATSNGYTGARLDWKGGGKESLSLFYTMPQQREPATIDDILDNRVDLDREGKDLQFWGGIGAIPNVVGTINGEAYVYVLDEDDRPDMATRNRHLITPGVRFFIKPAKGKWDAEVEAIYQFGSIRQSTAANAARRDVSAYLLHGELGYSFDSAWSPRLSAAADVASGDHKSSQSYNRFDTLFGTRRWEYGPTGIFGPLHRNNIGSVVARIEALPTKRMDVMASLRHAWLDSATDSFARTGIIDASGKSGRDGGDQVEARMRYWLLPQQAQLDLGGAILFKGDFLKNAPNVRNTGDTHYAYADLTFYF